MMRFLLIDTDSTFSSMLEQMLRSRGVDCASFANAKMGYEALKHEGKAVSLVILSKEQTEENDGLAILEAIRKEYHIRNTPVILLSSIWGKAEFAKHQKSESGANGYFNKSTPVTEFESVIESVLGGKFIARKPVAPAAPQKDAGAPPPSPIPEPGSISSITLEVSNSGAEPESSDSPVQLFEAKEVLGGAPVDKISIDFGPAVEGGASSVAQGAAVPPSPPEATVVPDLSSVSVTMAAPQLEKLVAQSEAAKKSVEPEPITIAPTSEPVALQQLTGVTNMASDIKLETTQLPTPPSTPELVEAPDTKLSDEDVAKELPYLFSENTTTAPPSNLTRLTSMGAKRPAYDVKISLPGSEFSAGGVGPAASGLEAAPDDVETLKRYLAMREQDVSVLTVQLTYAKEELAKSQNQIQEMALQNEDLFHQLDDLKRKYTELQAEQVHKGASVRGELDAALLEIKEKSDRLKLLESKLGDSAKQYDRLKDRVRVDIRKIRAREKELESKLEILRKDSETLIASRENKILDLKRKVDLLEFNYDVLQDKNAIERGNVQKANEKIERVLKVLRLALGMIESDDLTGETGASEQKDKDVQVS